MTRARDTLPLPLYYAATFAALGAYLPYFPAWLEGRGLRGLEMSAVASLLPLFGVVGPPLFGIAADALALRGWVLRVACLGAALPFFAVAALEARGVALGFAPLLGLVAVYAFFRSPMIMMADVVSLERVREGGADYGRTRLWGSLGFLALALAVGDRVDVRQGAALPFVIAAALFVSFAAALLLPARAAAPPPPLFAAVRTLVASPSYRLFLGVVFLAQIAHASYDLCASLRLLDLGASARFVGVFWASGVVFEIALMALAGRWAIASRAPLFLAVGIAGAVVRWILFAVVTSPLVLLALQPLHALSFGLVWLASVAYVQGHAEPGVASTAQGLFTAASGLGSVAGNLAWGALYDQRGGGVVFGSAALIGAIAAALAAWLATRSLPPTPRYLQVRKTLPT